MGPGRARGLRGWSRRSFDISVYVNAGARRLRSGVGGGPRRLYNLPMDVSKDGKVVYVSPFDIHLPEDDNPEMPKRVTNGER